MSEKIRELEKQIELAGSPAERVKLLAALAFETRFSDLARSLEIAREAQELASAHDDASGLADAEHMLGSIYEAQGDYHSALEHLHRSSDYYAKTGSDESKTITNNNMIAKVYANLGDYAKGLDFLFRSLRTAQEKGYRVAEANTLNSMSVFYQRMNDAVNAESCSRQCLVIAQESGDRRTLGITRINLGNAYGLMKDWERAVDQWEIGQAIFEAMGDADLQSSTLGNLGIAFQNMGDYEKAEEFMLQCLAIKEKGKNRYDVIRSLQNLASVNCTMKRYEKALEYCERAFAIDAEINVKSISYLIWKERAMIYKGMGQFEKALADYEKYHALEKELFTEESRQKTKQLQVSFEMEKTEKEKEIYRLKNISLAEANEQITRQKEEIEQQNKDITASIRYAKRIQEALLPLDSALRHGFSGAFVFFRPRDIVSGDFYWSLISDDAVLFAVADCTGHGVPGALMSVMGAAFLSEIVNERGVTDPAEALNLLRLKVITALHRQGEEEQENDEQLRDGMDMILCRLEPATGQLRFACANNPLWLLRDGAITEFEPDKFPVGLHHGQLQYFRSNKIDLKRGDRLFLFTDGFADQFGGPQEKKFGYKRMRELLVQTGNLPAQEQRSAIEQAFLAWKEEHEQVDDVLLVGLSYD